MSLSRSRRSELKIKAAYYYYKKNMKLVDIANILNVSRVTLNSLLSDAIKDGVVHIDIVDPNNTLKTLELEESAKARFGLERVVIVDSLPGEENHTRNEVAFATAGLVDGMMKSGKSISMTWGKTLEQTIEYMKGNSRVKNCKVFSLLGALGVDSAEYRIQPNIIVHNFLQKYKGTGYLINAPFLCESEMVAQALLEDKNIAKVISDSIECDISLVGIGPKPNIHVHRDLMRYDPEIIRGLEGYDVCGDIGASFYDIYGNIVDAPICRRFVRVGLEDIKKQKCVIGSASGPHKIESILGALNGHYLDILVTDRVTMESVMKLADVIKK